MLTKLLAISTIFVSIDFVGFFLGYKRENKLKPTHFIPYAILLFSASLIPITANYSQIHLGLLVFLLDTSIYEILVAVFLASDRQTSVHKKLVNTIKKRKKKLNLNLIQLHAEEFSLNLKTVKDNGWCRVFLIQEDKIREIGADSIKVIIQKLLLVLDIENFPECKATLGNHKYACCIMLWEKHTTVYARLVSDGIEMFFQGDMNHELLVTFLSAQECKKWRDRLLEISSSF